MPRAVAVVLCLAGIVLLIGSTSRADAASPPIVAFELTQQVFDQHGNPWLSANPADDGSVAPSWARCVSSGFACSPTGVTNQVLEPGPTPAGTVFQASASIGGTVHVARSRPWLGTVTSTAPPTLAGVPQVGRRVQAVAGSWAGGWGDDFSRLSVEACRTRGGGGGGCTTIAHPAVLGGGDGSAALDARWTGRYLFAFEERFAQGTAFPAIGYPSPEAIPPLAVGPTVARSAPLGPVRGPRLALRRRARLLRGGRLLVGRVTCARPCRVVASVREASRPSGPWSRARMRARGTSAIVVPLRRLSFSADLVARVRIGSTPAVTGVVTGARR